MDDVPVSTGRLPGSTVALCPPADIMYRALYWASAVPMAVGNFDWSHGRQGANEKCTCRFGSDCHKDNDHAFAKCPRLEQRHSQSKKQSINAKETRLII